MPPELKIRTADMADRDLLVALGRETFFTAFAGTCRPEDMALFLDESFAPEKVAAELATPRSTFHLLLDESGAAVGYARLYEDPAPPEFITLRPALEIVRFYLREAAIGKGYGSFLMEHCLAEARRGGYRSVYLGVWEHNERAQKFYAKHGFVKRGEKIFWVGRDGQTDWYMEKTLAAQ
jgi:ribosomal protein S18 acetylase RimI-like enzyme